MPYTPTVWTDEVPSSTPVKYAITDDVNGQVAGSATIEMVTPVTAGTPINAANLNRIESALQVAFATAEAALAAVITPAQIVDAIWKIGDLYISTSPVDPATKYGVGTWESYGAGRVLVGIDPSQAEFNAAGETGGAKNVSLAVANLPPHDHPHEHSYTSKAGYASSGDGGALTSPRMDTDATYSTFGKTSSSVGSGSAFSVLQPYIVVYTWRRIA